MTPGTLRVGVVGTGFGALVHVPAFGIVEGFEMAAICGRSPERSAVAGQRLGIADVSTDWASFVRRADLDVISVATPVELHHEVALAALQAGKHVLCEKPLARTTAETAEMVAAAESSDRATATSFEMRWRPERLRISKLVGSGQLGTPYFCRLVNSDDYWHPSRSLQSLWMYHLSQGGGYLAGLVAHDIDWLAGMFGLPVQVCADVRVTIPARRTDDGSDVVVTADDTSVLIMRMSSGALVELGTTVMGAHLASWRFEAMGSDGTVTASAVGRRSTPTLQFGRASDAGLQAIASDARRPLGDPELPQRGASTLIRAMALLLEDWLPALTGGVSAAPTFRDGHLVQEVIEAARASSAGAGWVDIAG
jgi:predicted dehydrogenase